MAGELAQICRAGDLDTLLCLFAMATCEPHVTIVPETLMPHEPAPPCAEPDVPAAEDSRGVVVAFPRARALREFHATSLGGVPAGM